MLIYGKKTGAQVGVAATLAVPIGSEDSFTGDGGIGGEAFLTGGYAAPRYRLIANAGVRFRPEADYITSDQGTELIGRAGVIVPFAKNRLQTSLELDLLARTSGNDAYGEYGSPLLALLGARYHFPSGLRAGAGIGMGLTEAPGSPAVRALVTVGYSPEPSTRKKPLPPPRLMDADNDGIIDTLDKCPQLPEDGDGDADGDGCPDPDGDKDQIVDHAPDPAKPLTLEQVITLPAPIQFEFDTAIMLPGSDVYLFQVLEVLKKHPEVLKLEIQGHTSSEGGPDYNLRLSNDRAKAVYTWLVDHGIDAKRLVAKGYGLTVPLVPNDSEPNRARNRRVQFRMLEQAPGLPPIRTTPTPPPGDAAARDADGSRRQAARARGRGPGSRRQAGCARARGSGGSGSRRQAGCARARGSREALAGWCFAGLEAAGRNTPAPYLALHAEHEPVRRRDAHRVAGRRDELVERAHRAAARRVLEQLAEQVRVVAEHEPARSQVIDRPAPVVIVVVLVRVDEHRVERPVGLERRQHLAPPPPRRPSPGPRARPPRGSRARRPRGAGRTPPTRGGRPAAASARCGSPSTRRACRPPPPCARPPA